MASKKITTDYKYYQTRKHGGWALCVVGMEGVYIEVGGYTENDEEEWDNKCEEMMKGGQ